jgi:hypothetical protein
MAPTKQYQYTPALEDFYLFSKEYSRTREGKSKTVIAYGKFIGVLLSILLIVFCVYLVWFQAHDPSLGINIGPYLLDRSILSVWGYVLFLFLIILIRSVFFQKVAIRQFYKNHPELQSLKVFDLTKTFYHEHNDFSEIWFQWDAIYHAIKTDNFYMLSAKDTIGIVSIPLKCLDENGKAFLNGLINNLSDKFKKEKHTLQRDKEIQPEPQSRYVQLSRAFSITDTISISFERIWFLSDLFKLIKVGALVILLVCALGFLMISINGFLIYMKDDLNLILILFLGTLLLLLGIPIYHSIIGFIRYMTDKNKHFNINFLVDENGFFLGRSSVAFNFYWSYFSKIIITRRNYFFKAKYDKCRYTIPKKWLTEPEVQMLEEILGTVVENNPGLTLKKVTV